MPPGPPVVTESTMLTFAAMTTPAKARGAALSLHDPAGATGDLASDHGALRTAAVSHAHYWPCELERLAVARAIQDHSLNALALRLQAYFDVAAPQGCAVVAEISEV